MEVKFACFQNLKLWPSWRKAGNFMGIHLLFLDLSEWHCKKSVLALVDGEVWDMYRPLTKSCEIQFLTFKDENPEEVNKVSDYLIFL